VDAFQNNWIGFFEMLPNYRPSARFWREDGLVVGISRLPIAAFNAVIVHEPTVLTPAHLAHFTDIFNDEALPFCVQVNSQDSVAACKELMIDSGYTELFIDPIMIREGPLQLPAMNPQVKIRPVRSQQERAEYEQVVSEVFSLPPQLSEFFEMFWAIPDCLQVIADIDGEPAGTGMLLCANGSAGIYNVATLAEKRGQGIGSAVMGALHNYALDHGYGGTVLASSGAGYGLYQDLGYRLDGYQTSFALPGIV
jgi:GNAT superfamily N-acetyltransferase